MFTKEASSAPLGPGCQSIDKEDGMKLISSLRRGSRGPQRATWNDTVIAEAAATTRVDGYEYFPPESVDWSHLEPISHVSACPRKGVATYYDVVDGDRRLPAAAWTYADPNPAATHIKGHVGFWRGVTVGEPT